MFFGSSCKIAMALFVLLITMGSLVAGATGAFYDVEPTNMQPCPFNQLCRCSRGGPEVGMVYCEDIPLGDVPNGINNTKSFAINLRRNGLRRIEEDLFHRTGLWRIDIRQNLLDRIAERTFAGVERTLGELVLSANRLLRVPERALRNLQKLRVLDLSNNQIDVVKRFDFSGVESTLETVSLADNYILTLEMDTFRGFKRLEKLDMQGNSILTVVPMESGTLKLTHFNLAENSLDRIPFTTLTQMKSLHTINLAKNRISSTYDETFKGKLSVDTLILDDNMIDTLGNKSFRNFEVVNRTQLNGNWIKEIDGDAFEGVKIRDLSIVDSTVSKINATAFRGLEGTLQTLDLQFNDLKKLPKGLFDKFDLLRTIWLGNNPLSFNAEEVMNSLRFTLDSLYLNGEFMGSIKELKTIRNLRSLGLCSMDGDVSGDDFEGFGPALEHLNVQKNNLKSVSANAFKHIPGIKYLDMSENRIDNIAGTAFDDIATSLSELKMVNGLSMSSLDSAPFKKLRAMRHLDLSGNKITTIAGDFFHKMRDLRTVNLQDNRLDKVSPQYFRNDYTPDLVNITLAFNHIGSVDKGTFKDLNRLRVLDMADNKIKSIAKGAFMNMENLETIYLEDNSIDTISNEAFHNLPKLSTLNLAYNSISRMSFDWLDQVGTLSAIKLDVSHNSIGELSANRSGWSAYSSVRSLDLGYNNIKYITRNYFEPIRSSLTHLVLRHNQLTNISRDIYSEMEHLHWLDFSNNRIQLVDSDAFINTKSLQVLLLDHNEISEIYQDMLIQSPSLQIVSLAHNKLRFLPDTLFHDTQLEIFDVSHNLISKMPENCLSRVSDTLRHFDISHNQLTILNPEQFRKMINLVHLDLSYNKIHMVMDKAFYNLNRLTHLDLSYNPMKNMSGQVFDTLLGNLCHLNLASIGKIDPSEYHLAKLVSFNISDNEVEAMPSDFFKRFAHLKELDISKCGLTEMPESPWSTGSRLRALHLNGNRLRTITNSTLAGLKSLEYLNVGDMTSISVFQDGSLSQLTALRHLAIGTYSGIRSFSRLLEYNQVLKHLEMMADGSLDSQLGSKLPFKINNVTFSGPRMSSVGSSALSGLQGKSLTINVRTPALTSLPRGLFQNLGNTRWLKLELRDNKMTSVYEPSTTIYPGTPKTVFLTHLQMSGNPWSCDCTTGWVEFWLKKWRQYYCKERCSDYYTIMRDLRRTTCDNKSKKSFVTVLQNDLECGWSSAMSVTNSWHQWTIIVLAGTALIKQLSSFTSS